MLEFAHNYSLIMIFPGIIANGCAILLGWWILHTFSD